MGRLCFQRTTWLYVWGTLIRTGVDYNHGTDDKGDPIYAIASGEVVAYKRTGQVRGFGNSFIIKTKGVPPGVKGSHLYHRYLHCDRVLVKVGQKVRAGQQIATVGTTGGVPAHLHLDTWTDRNGLGVHWAYHKNTQLSSYEDPYRLIQANPKWDEGGSNEIMDTDAKVKAQYYTLRGNEGTAKERKAWIGKTYEEFNAKARPEVANRTQNVKNLESAVSTLRKERDAARAEVVEVGKKLLAERDKVKVLEAGLKESDAELVEAKEAFKQIETAYQNEIDDLNKVIATKDKEIEKLTIELSQCGTDCDKLTGWELMALAIKKILGRSK